MRPAQLIAFFGVQLACLAGPTAAQDTFFQSDDVQIRYIDQGSGEPVVLLHGNGGWIEAQAAEQDR